MENIKQVKVADLSVRPQDEMLPWYVYLLPIIITVGVIGYGYIIVIVPLVVVLVLSTL